VDGRRLKAAATLQLARRLAIVLARTQNVVEREKR